MNAFRIACLAVAAQLMLAAGPAVAEFPGPSGRIYFTTPNRTDFPPSCGVASVSADGTAYSCVDPFGFDPSISPNHKLIVEERPGQPVPVYTVTSTGRGARRLTHTGSADNLAPTFSPDSRRILYFQSGGLADGMYVMNDDGSGQRRLTADAGFGPVFSPNGAQIAYWTTGITLASADGTGSHVIRPNTRTLTGQLPAAMLTNVTNSEPNWSPDGRQIAFTRRTVSVGAGGPASDQTDVYAMNADGSGVRQLTSTPGVNEEEPSWSPNGRQIAYFRMPRQNPDGVGQIWVMNADGSGKRAVAQGWHPHWSTVQSGPGRPKLLVQFRKLSKHSQCFGRYDGFFASVKTRASKRTLFDIAMYIDKHEVEQTSDTTGLGTGVDTLGRGRHRLKVIATDPAVHDGMSRTINFRRC